MSFAPLCILDLGGAVIDLERKFSAPLDRERGMRRFSTEGGREEPLGIISPAATKPGRGEEELRSYGTRESGFRKRSLQIARRRGCLNRGASH